MKKLFLIFGLLFISSACFVVANPTLAAAKTKRLFAKIAVVKKSPKTALSKKQTSKNKLVKKPVSLPIGLKWDQGAKKAISRLASFDYSVAIRNAYIKKVEKYAKQHKVHLITASYLKTLRI